MRSTNHFLIKYVGLVKQLSYHAGLVNTSKDSSWKFMTMPHIYLVIYRLKKYKKVQYRFIKETLLIYSAGRIEKA